MLRKTGQFYGYRAEQNSSDQNRRSKFKLSGGLREQVGAWALGRLPSGPALLHQGLPLPLSSSSSLPEWKLSFRFWLLRAGFLPRK